MSIVSPLESDLVRDSRLPTAFLPDGGIQHTLWRSGRSGRRQRTKKTEIWRRESNKQIGTGSFGQVWLERSGSDQVRALKTIRKVARFSAMNYARELEAAAKFSHDRYVDCFVESYGWFEDDQHIYLAMEYLEHGDLGMHLDKVISEKEAKDITYQLVQGLNHMHENKFVHRDLKPQNILVAHPGPRWWVKIADFGISKRAREGTAGASTAIGTERYCAPEVLCVTPSTTPRTESLDQTCKASRDLWALGEVLFRMLAKRPAFESSYILYRFVEGHETLQTRLEILRSQGFSSGCSKFVEELLVVDPQLRMTASEAASHPWLVSATLHSPSSSRSSTPPLEERLSQELLSSPAGDSAAPAVDALLEGSAQWTTAPLEEDEKTILPDRVSIRSNASLGETVQHNIGSEECPTEVRTTRQARKKGKRRDSTRLGASSGGKAQHPCEQGASASNESSLMPRSAATLANEDNSGDHYTVNYNGVSYRLPNSSTAVFSDPGISITTGNAKEVKKDRKSGRSRRKEGTSIGKTPDRAPEPHTGGSSKEKERLQHRSAVGHRLPKTPLNSAKGSSSDLRKFARADCPEQMKPLERDTIIRMPRIAIQRLLLHTSGELRDDLSNHPPYPKLFYCTQPACNHYDPRSLVLQGQSPAFWSLDGLLNHIFLHHIGGHPPLIDSFICSWPSVHKSEKSGGRCATFQELMDHVLQHVRQAGEYMEPVFSWNFSSESAIWIAAFPSYNLLAKLAAVQYAPLEVHGRSSQNNIKGLANQNQPSWPGSQNTVEPTRALNPDKILNIDSRTEKKLRNTLYSRMEGSVSQLQGSQEQKGVKYPATHTIPRSPDRSGPPIAPGAKSNVVSQSHSSSRRSDDAHSNRTGTFKTPITDPKLLDKVEEAIRRLILPELSALKREQNKREERGGQTADSSRRPIREPSQYLEHPQPLSPIPSSSGVFAAIANESSAHSQAGQPEMRERARRGFGTLVSTQGSYTTLPRVQVSVEAGAETHKIKYDREADEADEDVDIDNVVVMQRAKESRRARKKKVSRTGSRDLRSLKGRLFTSGDLDEDAEDEITVVETDGSRKALHQKKGLVDDCALLSSFQPLLPEAAQFV